MSSRWRAAAAAAAAASVAACGKSAQIAFGPVTSMSASTAVGTAPMLAASPAGVLASAWVSAPEGGTDGRLYVDAGQAAPTEIRDSLGPIEGHGESPPKIEFGPDGALNAIYVVVKDVPTANAPLEALRFVRSTDGGKTWSHGVTVTDDAEFGTHNFHSLLVSRDGVIYVSWLGGEEGKTAVWLTRSSDRGATWAPAIQVSQGQVCDCCRTALASAPDGSLYIAWRRVYPGNLRDVVVARSTDHGASWGEAVRVHPDGWSIQACPRAGPSLQVDSAGRVHVAWWTGKSGAAGVWYARSDDRGATFGPPVPLGVAKESRAAHVQLALAPGGIVAAAWDDGTLARPRVELRLSRDGGNNFGTAQWLSDSGVSVGFPVLAVSHDSLTAAWSQSGSTAPMAMPKSPGGHRGIKPIGDGGVVMRQGALP